MMKMYKKRTSARRRFLGLWYWSQPLTWANSASLSLSSWRETSLLAFLQLISLSIFLAKLWFNFGHAYPNLKTKNSTPFLLYYYYYFWIVEEQLGICSKTVIMWGMKKDVSIHDLISLTLFPHENIFLCRGEKSW